MVTGRTRSTTIGSPIGPLTLTVTDSALSGVHFGEDLNLREVDEVSVDSDPTLAHAARQLGEYFAGRRTEFTLALHLEGTEFQVSAWRALALAPFGGTMSYSEQARAIGRPKAVRAVGGANGRNPVAIVLPCHRVVGANGSLTGFAGGLDVKRWLLGHEQAVVARESERRRAHSRAGATTGDQTI